MAEAVQPPADWETTEQHFSRGNLLYNEGKADESLATFRKALELQPDFVPARYNLGVVLGNLDRFDEAVAELENVIAADAGHADAHNSLGFIMAEQSRHQSAIEHFERTIAIASNHAQAHHNLGLMLLRIGKYPRGFQELEWRWRTPGFTPFSPPQPRWDGSPQPEKTLLIHTEQGARDALQMARLIAWAAQRVKQILLLAPSEMQELLRDLPGVSEVRGAGTLAADSFDLWAPMMSLPLLYGLTPENIPAADAYLRPPLRPGLALPDEGLPRVGVCWAGSPTQGKDRLRSSRLGDWRALLATNSIRFFSLQKGEAAEAQLADLPEKLRPIDLTPKIQDWGDTAALIDRLDLVITVDTGGGAPGRGAGQAGVDPGLPWRRLAVPRQRRKYTLVPEHAVVSPGSPGQWGPVLARVAKELVTWRTRLAATST